MEMTFILETTIRKSSNHREEGKQTLIHITKVPLNSQRKASSSKLSCVTSSASIWTTKTDRISHVSSPKFIEKATRKGMGSSMLWWWSCLLLSTTLLLSSFGGLGQAEAKHAWERPGCHKVGHTRKVSIPECIEFSITTNACRGYCESFAVPSSWNRLKSNPTQAITSVGQCCNIMETEDVVVNVMCLNGERELVFKSAKSCDCFHCKKD